jgi:EmrB/QacA subfamily drug resistance transporter
MSIHEYAPQPPTRMQSLLASRWAPLPVVLSGTFMVVLDFFIVNVALPSIQSSLSASASAIEFVTAGYALTSAVFLILGGRLGDRLGRRRMFATGMALFTLSSAACGAAGTPEVLVMARLLQGTSAALMMPNILAIMGVVFTGEDRVKALSVYGLVMGLAAALGQLIGGVLVAANIAGLGWRACFLINVPVGATALALTPRLIPESRAPKAGALDLLGTVLVTVGLAAIVVPLVLGRQHGWPLWTWLSLAAAPVMLAAFVLHERSLTRAGGSPLLDLSLFRERSFSAGLIAQLVFWMGQASFFLVFALYLQQGRHLTALHAGLVFTILAVSYLVASAKAQELATRHGRRVIAAGALTLAAGHVVTLTTVGIIGVGGSVLTLTPGLLLIGAGMGLGIAPLATLIMSTMRPEQAGSASSSLATMQNVGNALGIAVIGVIYFGTVNSNPAHPFAEAFELSLAALAAVLLSVAALTRLMPAPVRS